MAGVFPEMIRSPQTDECLLINTDDISPTQDPSGIQLLPNHRAVGVTMAGAALHKLQTPQLASRDRYGKHCRGDVEVCLNCHFSSSEREAKRTQRIPILALFYQCCLLMGHLWANYYTFY